MSLVHSEDTGAEEIKYLCWIFHCVEWLSSSRIVWHHIPQAMLRALKVFVSFLPNHYFSLSSNCMRRSATNTKLTCVTFFFNSALFLNLGWVMKDLLHNPQWVSAFLSLFHAATRRAYQLIFDVCQMCSNRRTGAWCNDRLLKRNFIPHQQPNNKPHLPSTSPASRKMAFLSVSSLWPYMVANSTEASLVVGRQSPGRRFTLFGIRFFFCFFCSPLCA